MVKPVVGEAIRGFIWVGCTLLILFLVTAFLIPACLIVSWTLASWVTGWI